MEDTGMQIRGRSVGRGVAGLPGHPLPRDCRVIKVCEGVVRAGQLPIGLPRGQKMQQSLALPDMLGNPQASSNGSLHHSGQARCLGWGSDCAEAGSGQICVKSIKRPLLASQGPVHDINAYLGRAVMAQKPVRRIPQCSQVCKGRVAIGRLLHGEDVCEFCTFAERVIV